MRIDNPLTHRATYSWWTKERIRWSDTDMLGHVNNLAIAAYFEIGRSEFLRHVVARDAERRVMLVLVKLTVNFIGEIHWPGDVEISTGITDIGRSSCTMGHGLFDGERCISYGESVVVMIDETTRKPCEIPGWVREYLGKFNIAKSG